MTKHHLTKTVVSDPARRFVPGKHKIQLFIIALLGAGLMFGCAQIRKVTYPDDYVYLEKKQVSSKMALLNYYMIKIDEILLEDSEEDQVLQQEVFDEPEPIHYGEPEEVEVPEPTEEEMTVNMAIDQELLAIAVEDDDGFTSTIVQKQLADGENVLAEDQEKEEDQDEAESSNEVPIDEDEPPDEVPVMPVPEDSPLMETIIMEGESVLNEEDQERLAAAREAASESLKKAGFDEPKTNFRDWRPPKYSMGATAAVLFVILLVIIAF